LKKRGLGANREALVYASPRHGPHGPLDSEGTSMDELHLGRKKKIPALQPGEQRAVFLTGQGTEMWAHTCMWSHTSVSVSVET